MDDNAIKIHIKNDLRPAYYDDFHCLSAGCDLNCCKGGWHITFDKKDYLSLKHQKGSPELNDRMDGALRRIRRGSAAEKFYGEFNMERGACPLLRDDCLCTLQAEKGHDALPYVCRSFPRGEAYRTTGFWERSLSPACEGVLALLWDLPDGVEFRSDPLPKEKQGTLTVEIPGLLLSYYHEIRSVCIDFLQERQISLSQRILLLGLALKKLADGETDIPRWLAQSRQLIRRPSEVGPSTQESGQMLSMFLFHNIKLLQTLKTRDDGLGRNISTELMTDLGVKIDRNNNCTMIPLSTWRSAHACFYERFGQSGDSFMENLMVSLFFHLRLPDISTSENLWKSYVNFCNLYSFYRFVSVMSCREGSAGNRGELFRLVVYASRSLIHNSAHSTTLRDELFQNDSATLAHMAILLCGADQHR